MPGWKPTFEIDRTDFRFYSWDVEMQRTRLKALVSTEVYNNVSQTLPTINNETKRKNANPILKDIFYSLCMDLLN